MGCLPAIYRVIDIAYGLYNTLMHHFVRNPCILSSCNRTTMGQTESQRAPTEEYMAEKALRHYFFHITTLYRKSLIERFGDVDGNRLYGRSYLQFATLWFCKNVIGPFSEWFAAVLSIDNLNAQDIDVAWNTLETVLDLSVKNMIEFIAAIQKAHGHRDWLTVKQGLGKALDVFLAITGNPPYMDDASFVWDMINHKQFMCLSTANIMVFIEEILGEWDQVIIGTQYEHSYVVGIAELEIKKKTPFKMHTPTCMVRDLYITTEQEEDVKASQSWSLSAMQDLQLPLAYEGQSAFMFQYNVETIRDRAPLTLKRTWQYLNITYLTNNTTAGTYFDYLIGKLEHGRGRRAPLRTGIAETLYEGIAYNAFLETVRDAIVAAPQVVAQASVMTRLNGSYGKHPFGTEHGLWKYYIWQSSYFHLGEGPMLEFKQWILMQEDVGYLRLFMRILVKDNEPIPADMYLLCAEHVPFYYWNYRYVLAGIAGALSQMAGGDTIPPLLYRLPLHIALLILSYLRQIQQRPLSDHDAWDIFVYSTEPIVPSTMPTRLPPKKMAVPVWEYDTPGDSPTATEQLYTLPLYMYLANVYVHATELVDDFWEPAQRGHRTNPVYLAEFNKKYLEAENIAYYAKYSLWFEKNTTIFQENRMFYTRWEGTSADLESGIRAVVERVDFSDGMKELIRKLMELGAVIDMTTDEMLNAWHPYIHMLFLSEKKESNLLMITIMVFIIKSNTAYFLKFAGDTKAEYISHRSPNAKAAITRHLRREILHDMEGISMWDALMKFK